MLTLPINTEDLLAALRERSPQVESWLDRETGDIYQISTLFGDDEVEDDPAFVQAMQQTPSRFLRLPTLPAAIAYSAMREFHASVTEPTLHQALAAALQRQRAFFHFQDVLATLPTEQRRWQELNRDRILGWADAWLAGHDLSRQR